MPGEDQKLVWADDTPSDLPRQKQAQRVEAFVQSSPKVVALDRHRWLEHLHRTYSQELCRWISRRFGAGPPEPEDVVQIAFCKIAELDDLSQIRNPRAFLYTVAVRTCISACRTRERTVRFIDEAMRENGEEVEEITPERVYLEKERLRMVESGLLELTDMQRELVYRSRILGETFADIREQTGWSLASISRQLRAALARISSDLAAQGEDGAAR